MLEFGLAQRLGARLHAPALIVPALIATTSMNAAPDGAVAALGDETGASGALDGRRVLVVEDEAMVAMDLTFTFEDAGAAVVGPAASLADGLGLVGEEPIDAAVLDVDLQGREVYPLAERLMERGVPFLFHTGHGRREQLSQLFPGVHTCIKPTMAETLVAEVGKLLKRTD